MIKRHGLFFACRPGSGCLGRVGGGGFRLISPAAPPWLPPGSRQHPPAPLSGPRQINISASVQTGRVHYATLSILGNAHAWCVVRCSYSYADYRGREGHKINLKKKSNLLPPPIPMKESIHLKLEVLCN